LHNPTTVNVHRLETELIGKIFAAFRSQTQWVEETKQTKSNNNIVQEKFTFPIVKFN